MAFLALASELHLKIFRRINDLDDASCLAQSCSYLWRLYNGNKKAIVKSIIVSDTLVIEGAPLALQISRRTVC